MKSALRVIAGHGGADPGAVAGGIIERDLNIAAVLSFNDAASREYKPHDVTTVVYPASDGRDGDTLLLEKIAGANSAGADQLLIEVHHNAGAPAPGAQLWYSQRAAAKVGDETWQVAPILQTELGFLLGVTIPLFPSSSSRFGKLGILDDVNCTAVLIEARNVSPEDTAPWEYSFGVMLAKAMAKYFGWPPAVEISPLTPAPHPVDGRLEHAKKIAADAAAAIGAL